MRLSLLAVGRLKSGPERELVERYRQRVEGMGRASGLAGFDIVELPESRARRDDDRRSEEAAALLERAGLVRADRLRRARQEPLERSLRRTNQAMARRGPLGLSPA